jgi:hypothetical protein
MNWKRPYTTRNGTYTLKLSGGREQAAIVPCAGRMAQSRAIALASYLLHGRLSKHMTRRLQPITFPAPPSIVVHTLGWSLPRKFLDPESPDL